MNVLACMSVLLAAVSGLVAVPAGTADAVGFKCHGRPASLVGSAAESRLIGTPGDDVMVSNGSTRVNGRRGNDTICVIGAYDDVDSVLVVAGRGDDYVRNELSNRAVSAILGEGDDRYLGGSGSDTVEDTEPDIGSDWIDTGSGNDHVFSGNRDEPNSDHIDLGPGADALFLHSWDNTQISLDGGEGQDWLYNPPIGGEAVVYDNRAGVATRDGVPYLAWSAFERFTLSGGTTQTFLGSGRNERVIFEGHTIAANMRGGNDTIVVRRGSQQSDLLRGGTGTDTLQAYDEYVGATVAADLGTQIINFSAPGASEETTYHFAGINALDVTGDTVRLYGDGEGNRLNALGCSAAFVNGRGGDDVITDTGHFLERPCSGDYGDPLFRGGAGNDRLVGATSKHQHIVRNETLLGGRGNDVANGNGGHEDVCHAETERACELD